MPTIVSHPYFFKYILYTICENQLSRTFVSSDGNNWKYAYKSSNDIFSKEGNELTISFINQFTEGKSNQEVINLQLGKAAILEILNYDFKSDTNLVSSLDPKDVSLLNKWNKEYGMLDNWE